MDGSMVRWRWTMATWLALAACGSGNDDPDESGADASTDGSSVGGSLSAEGGTTGEPGGPCGPGDLELVDVALDVTTHRVMSEDVATPYDPQQGSHACATVLADQVQLFVDYGPFGFGGPQSHLFLRIRDGARPYDLATDAGVPLMDMPGDIELGYSYQVSSAGTVGWNTASHAATGTVDVIALPVDDGTTFEFTAQGEMGGADGWQFDLSFTGTVAP